MRDLVPMKKLVSGVVKVVGNYTKRPHFINHSTVSEDNYGVVKVTQNHNFPIMNPG